MKVDDLKVGAQICAKEQDWSIVSPIGKGMVVEPWAKAWLFQLGRYELHHGVATQARKLLRCGCVQNLDVGGEVSASVYCGEIYEVAISFEPLMHEQVAELKVLASTDFTHLYAATTHKPSLKMLEMLVSFFPTLHELSYSCSCVEDASPCSHVVSVLYAVAVSIDHEPSLFMKLFNIKDIGEDVLVQFQNNLSSDVISDDEIGKIFGI